MSDINDEKDKKIKELENELARIKGEVVVTEEIFKGHPVLSFSGAFRPVKFLDGIYDLYLIEGVQMRSYFSFPSGHAATAFGLFLCLAVIARSNLVKFSCFLLAFLTAFSRVYLSQHFLEDIYFGSLIGVLFALLFYRILFSSGKKWLDHHILFNIKAG